MSAAPLSARLTTGVTKPGTAHLPSAPISGLKGDDSLQPGSGVTRVSAARAARVIRQLSEAERQLVAHVAIMRVATGRQLQRLCFGHDLAAARRCRRHLARLSEERVLARLRLNIGGRSAGSAGYVYSLDVVGQRLVEPDGARRRPWTPGPAFLVHALLTSECYVRLVELSRTGTAETTGAVELLGFQGEPACWRQFWGAGGAAVVLKPDAFVRVGIGAFEDCWWLEVDLGSEHPARLAAKAMVYLDCWRSGAGGPATGPDETGGRTFPRVLWVTTSARRAGQIVGALGRLSAEHWQLFQVCTLEQFASVMAAGAGAASVVGHGRDEVAL